LATVTRLPIRSTKYWNREAEFADLFRINPSHQTHVGPFAIDDGIVIEYSLQRLSG